ncbi:N-formylglutamate amidohydrolase [Litoreibacter janthinus]|uniref:N-formylglutamate amidohydrolase n=1 Tax=Litoreibacter janthinus TaxID=670154 RepID=UPI001FEA51FA|nr:N-formylglutamate amidohydrolase [Litoreibacter janthinus]
MSAESFEIVGKSRPSRMVCLCDHATNTVPAGLPPRLGLPEADMARHIAYDVGAEGVTRALAEAFDGPALMSRFSRLVIDPNRGEDDPTLLMRLYDGSIIPANRSACVVERERRLNAYHRPYHTAAADLIAQRNAPVIVSIHSFTPQLNGRPPRPWHIGVLYAQDARLALPLLSRLNAEDDLCVGDNEPYSGHLPGDTMERHALTHGHLHVLIELRNDLIFTEDQQLVWAARLAPIITAAVADAET